MEFSETLKELPKALVEFRKNIKQPSKDAKNPFFKSMYVNLEGTTKAIDDIASDYGLTYIQNNLNDDSNTMIGVQTIIFHESGEYIVFDPLFLKPTKQDPQAYGSAVTYARRYTLSTAFGITSDVDDDGNGANGNGANKPQPKPQPSINERINSGYKAIEKIMPEFKAEKVNEMLLQRLGIQDLKTVNKEKLLGELTNLYNEVKDMNS